MNVNDEPTRDPADPELARVIRSALARERTPESWVESALAMARQADGTSPGAARGAVANARGTMDPRPDRPRAEAWVPAIASGVLLAGFGTALFVARGAMGAFLGDMGGMEFRLPQPLELVALAIIAPIIAFALAESVRGFPLLRRWFA